jgi:hypothetical protein
VWGEFGGAAAAEKTLPELLNGSPTTTARIRMMVIALGALSNRDSFLAPTGDRIIVVSVIYNGLFNPSFEVRRESRTGNLFSFLALDGRDGWFPFISLTLY